MSESPKIGADTSEAEAALNQLKNDAEETSRSIASTIGNTARLASQFATTFGFGLQKQYALMVQSIQIGIQTVQTLAAVSATTTGGFAAAFYGISAFASVLELRQTLIAVQQARAEAQQSTEDTAIIYRKYTRF